MSVRRAPKGGLPVLATQVVRRKFSEEGELVDTHGDYAVAVRQLAAELDVPLLDIEKLSGELVRQLGPERSKKLYMWVEPGEFDAVKSEKKDETHLNAFGACRICDLAALEIRAKVGGPGTVAAVILALAGNKIITEVKGPL